jgi:hypothetical protein
MMIVKMQGGLANKMFQFSLYKYLETRNIEVYIDNLSFKPAWNFEDIKLTQIFPDIVINYATPKNIIKFRGGNDLITRIRRKYPIFKIFKMKTFINEIINKATPAIIENLRGDYYLQGTWSNEAYFKNIGSIIKKEFKFQDFINNKNIDLMNNLLTEESVAIHIRKGKDYNNSRMQGTCGVDYYNRAIAYISENISNPNFYVFTDNKQWVKDNIKGINYLLVDWNPIAGIGNHLDMQLMSFAKHNIIANSTYSWWGAWLNANPDKIVIGPKNWFNPNNMEFHKKSLSILPANWIAL